MISPSLVLGSTGAHGKFFLSFDLRTLHFPYTLVPINPGSHPSFPQFLKRGGQTLHISLPPVLTPLTLLNEPQS